MSRLKIYPEDDNTAMSELYAEMERRWKRNHKKSYTKEELLIVIQKGREKAIGNHK